MCAPIPGTDPELPILARNVRRFAEIGTRVIVSSPRAVDIADDKFLTFTTMQELGISIPDTVDLEYYTPGDNLPMPLPFILKPKINGSRSKDVFLIKDENSLRLLENNPCVQMNRFVAQAYIEGDEYTCGTVSVEGRHVGIDRNAPHIARWRYLQMLFSKTRRESRKRLPK
ncbi:ATP-grasp domain-containing protein [Cupriavidus basilensis]